MQKKLIILDRDGVINYDSPHYIKSPEEWIAIPGSLEAIVKLNQASYTVTVATNQAGVGRGLYTETTLQAIHAKMQNAVAALGGRIDSIFYCPHSPNDNCPCRKPKPGLLQQIAQHYQISLKNIPFIGDKISDMQAALAMECLPIFINPENLSTLSSVDLEKSTKITSFTDLASAVDTLLKPGN